MVHWRHELKYICDGMQLQLIENKIKNIMKPDPYTDNNGTYLIRNIYFDDYMNSCYCENKNGIDPRSKWRIRIYNCSKERITLEKKTKYQEMTNKATCQINSSLLDLILNGEYINTFSKSEDLLNEFLVKRCERLYRPVMLGEYIRKPFVYNEGNVRITFDCNIAVSNQFDHFFDYDISRVSVLPTGLHVLEVKWDDFLPDIIYQFIDEGHLLQSTFSKFYLSCNALEGRLFLRL